MLSRIKDYFEDRGVTTADFPKAFIAHEFLSVAFLALTWAACYHVQPSQSPLFAPINKTLQESNNFVFVKMRQSYQSVVSKAERRMYQEWFMKRGIDSGRMAISLAESTFFRKLAKPVTIPAKLWLTWKFVQVANVHGHEKDTDDNSNGGGEATATTTARAEGDRRRRKRRRKDVEESDRLRLQDEGDEPWWGWARGVLEGSPLRRGVRRSAGRGAGKRRRKAVCPPGGGWGPGCFVLPAAFATTPRLTKPVRFG